MADDADSVREIRVDPSVQTDSVPVAEALRAIDLPEPTSTG